MPRKPFDKTDDIKAIILAGGRDFGRCPLASRLPTALWPIAGKPVIERLLGHLARQGIKQAVVCSNDDSALLKGSIGDINSMQLKFPEEPLPVGTAGCIRDAAQGQRNAFFLVFSAGIISPPNVDALIRAHRTGKSLLTVMLEPDAGNGEFRGHTAGIYICHRSALNYIPKEGYCDIKEGLIPAILRAGKTIHTATLPQPIGNFRDGAGYLDAVSNYLRNCSDESIGLVRKKFNGSKNIWLADSANIDASARIYGPAVIMDRANISKGTVIFGPTTIGRNAIIGRDSLIVNSVLWEGAKVGEKCEIQRCLLDNNAVIPNNTVVEQEQVPYRKKNILQAAINKNIRLANDKIEKAGALLRNRFEKFNKLPTWFASKNPGKTVITSLSAIILLVVFIWSYWPQVTDLLKIWQRSDEYSSGLLVPFVAVYILWSRRHDIAQCRLRPSIWGLFAFAAAQSIRLLGLFFMYGSAERLSIMLSIASVVLLLCGWQFFRKIFTTLVFLGLMFPLPRSIHGAIMLPLQSWATSSAVFFLEMLGHHVIREGNILHINGATVAVAEACNGLRMIMAFFVFSSLVALLVRRAWWEKLIILASSIPIGLLCNSIRLTLTAIAFTILSGEHWEKIFHDFGGYAMMPLALGMVVFELWLLTKITTVPPERQAVLASK